MAEIRCEFCGNLFSKKTGRGRPPKYCSSSCRNKASYEPVEPSLAQCAACGDFFQRSHGGRRYCPNENCQRRRERERYRKRDQNRDYSHKKQCPCSDCGELTGGKPDDIVISHPCRRKNGPPIPTLEELRQLPPDGGDGLGWRHQRAVRALKRDHSDGSPCDWCGRPMWLDPIRNWDYDPNSNRRGNGCLQGDHKISRRECVKSGIPIPLPDRLLHGICNIQRGDGGNDHLAWVNRAAFD